MTKMGKETNSGTGAGRLAVIPRGERWLYVSWEHTPSDLRRLALLSHDSNLRLRVGIAGKRSDSGESNNFRVLTLHPRARGWYVPVPGENNPMTIEFGYFDRKVPCEWICLSRGSWPPASAGEDNRTTGRVHGLNGNVSSQFPFNHYESWVSSPEPPERDHGFLRHSKGLSSAQHFPQRQADPPGTSNVSGVPDSGSQQTADAIREDVQPVAITETGQIPADESTNSHPVASAANTVASPVLELNVDQVVRGRVKPGSRVYFQGRQVPVSDGYFSFRVSAPDHDRIPVLDVIIDSEDGRHREIRKIHLSMRTEIISMPSISDVVNPDIGVGDS